MLNIRDNCEFKHTFDELYAAEIASGDCEKLIAIARKYWNYYSEATTKEEIRILMDCKDRRTKNGKWAAIYRKKHGVHRSAKPAHHYGSFLMRERELNERDI